MFWLAGTSETVHLYALLSISIPMCLFELAFHALSFDRTPEQISPQLASLLLLSHIFEHAGA